MYKLLTCLVIILLGFTIYSTVRAQTVNVVVNVVGAPYFAAEPQEIPSSTTTSPTNVGDTLTFSAVGDDPISNDYYMIICKTDAVTANLNSPPTCLGDVWCATGSVSNGLEAICEVEIEALAPEINQWYAFICSSTTGGCSGSARGSGGSGAPFYVNHSPEFLSVINDAPKAPGESITWTVEATDPDVVGGDDRFRFYVCRSDRFENGSCVDGNWCISELSAGSSSCSYQIGNIAKDGGFGAYIFVTDEHGLQSNSLLQGKDSTFEISNVLPELVNIVLNEGNDINLTSGAFTNVKVSGTVVDRNSCNAEEISSVSASVYRSSIGYENCNDLSEADPNNCYPLVECQLIPGEVCEHALDTTLNYQCFINVIYHADPTDQGTVFDIDDWKATMNAVDDNNSLSHKEVSSGVNVNSLVSFAMGSEIGYGALNVGQVIDPVSREIEVVSYSNVGLDALLFGEPLTNGRYTVPVQNQRYAVDITAFDLAEVLSSTAKRFDLNLPKPTHVSASRLIYWGIEVPADLPAGDYSGANYLIGIKGDLQGW